MHFVERLFQRLHLAMSLVQLLVQLHQLGNIPFRRYATDDLSFLRDGTRIDQYMSVRARCVIFFRNQAVGLHHFADHQVRKEAIDRLVQNLRSTYSVEQFGAMVPDNDPIFLIYDANSFIHRIQQGLQSGLLQLVQFEHLSKQEGHFIKLTLLKITPQLFHGWDNRIAHTLHLL